MNSHKWLKPENISVFNKRLEILKQDTALYIPTGGGSVINCPLKYDTELTVKLSVNHTRVGIEGLLLNFELLSTIENYSIGSALTDFTGFASITFNPLNFNLTPGNYILNVYCDENSNYKNISTHRDLTILSDVPLLTINSIETYFLEEFQINATLTDSKCKSLIGKTITFRIIEVIQKQEYGLPQQITMDWLY